MKRNWNNIYLQPNANFCAFFLRDIVVQPCLRKKTVHTPWVFRNINAPPTSNNLLFKVQTRTTNITSVLTLKDSQNEKNVPDFKCERETESCSLLTFQEASMIIVTKVTRKNKYQDQDSESVNHHHLAVHTYFQRGNILSSASIFQINSAETTNSKSSRWPLLDFKEKKKMTLLPI